MNDLGKTIIKGKLRIVTPVHIGGAQEKHLLKGLDFINDGSTIYFLDEKKIIAKTKIDQYSNALATNNLEGLIKTLKLNLNDISITKSTITGEVGQDIKTIIKNALSGKPIIPGSSLKGAIRSILYNLEGGSRNNPEWKIFGNIAEDMLRFILVNDVKYDKSNYINTKTYNLKSSLDGGWKHSIKTNEIFSETGFTFPYEAICPDQISEYEIIFNQKLLETVISEQKSIDLRNSKIIETNKKIKPVIKIAQKVKNIFESKEVFLKTIQIYTNRYLHAEKLFFEKYKGDKYESIVTEINRLLSLNDKSPLLRLGLGSGFHSMTGDTLFDSHLIDGISENRGRTRGQLGRKDSSKSRKLAFEKIGNEYKFYPMGFVQLCTDDYYESIKDNLQVRSNISKIVAPTLDGANYNISSSISEPVQPVNSEIYKPKYTDPSKLKKIASIDAIVTGQNGKFLLFKPLVSGYDHIDGHINYSTGMKEGTVIQVQCKLEGNKLVYSGYPKKIS